MDGWMDGFRIAYSNQKTIKNNIALKIRHLNSTCSFFAQKSMAQDGWTDGWVGGRAGLRIVYSNQK